MPKKRILLVDDEKSLTTLLKLNLEETGNYDVRVENWPEDALAAAREFKPDLVLLDIIMPRMPGGNVAALIDNDPQLKGTPIVFLTPDGKHLGTINTGEATANCAWGDDGSVLYITADMFLGRIKTKTKGF